jgi:hypothetical protein
MMLLLLMCCSKLDMESRRGPMHCSLQFVGTAMQLAVLQGGKINEGT